MKKIYAVDDEKDLLFALKIVIEYFNDEYEVKTN